jgi:phage baseplate assembly protein W
MARNAIGVTLPLQLGNTGYFEQSFDILTQIKSNFINLILTRRGERVHQPEFGCRIHEYLFEQLTPDNIEGARLSVVQAVERWMPFLELVQFEFQTTPETIDKNEIRLYVGYRLRNNPNIQDSIVLTF